MKKRFPTKASENITDIPQLGDTKIFHRTFAIPCAK
jgi:hypothetical protein